MLIKFKKIGFLGVFLLLFTPCIVNSETLECRVTNWGNATKKITNPKYWIPIWQTHVLSKSTQQMHYKSSELKNVYSSNFKNNITRWVWSYTGYIDLQGQSVFGYMRYRFNPKKKTITVSVDINGYTYLGPVKGTCSIK